jgi:hypothetical protein
MMFSAPKPHRTSGAPERKLHEIRPLPGFRFDFSSVVTILGLLAGAVIGSLIAISLLDT